MNPTLCRITIVKICYHAYHDIGVTCLVSVYLYQICGQGIMENQLFTEQQETYLTQITIPVRLSCVSNDGWPIVLSLWYLYRDGKLLCATQENAKVVEYLREQPRCGFEIASDDPPYCGLRGRGEAEIQAEIGHEVLEQLLLRYIGNLDHPLAKRLLAKSDREVAIIITPSDIFTWNFSNRMTNIGTSSESKLCPN